MFATRLNRRIRCFRGVTFLAFLITAVAFCTSAFGQCNTSWIGPASGGVWNTSGNWNGGIPTSGTNACIDNGNAQHSAVTLNIGGAQVLNLTTDSDDSLNFTDNTNLTINGSSISNAGSITLNSTNDNTDLIIAGINTVTLSGGGRLTLGNNGANRVYSSGVTGMLVNQETIQGAGQLGAGSMLLTNQGTINANVSTPLIVSPAPFGAGVTNTGTMKATSGGTLDLRGSYANAGGTIQGLAGSTVELDGATINGGTLTTSGGGVMESINSATLNGVTISTGSTYTEPDNTSTFLQGTITNNGTIHLNSSNNNTDLKISGPVTLTGSGTLTMGNNGANRVYAPNGTDTLTNKQTIQGAGQLGAGSMLLTNQGTINANVSTPLIVSPRPFFAGVTNTGTMEATSGGTLDLRGGYANAGGTIQAMGAGSTVELDGATINGGTLTTSGGGVMESINSATLNGVTISTGSTYTEPDLTSTTLQGTITNNGTIQLNSTNDNTDLVISGPVTLTGPGTVTMGNNGANRIYAANGTDTLTNTQTIQGAGQLGVASLTLANEGTINANVSTPLIVAPGFGGATNSGGIVEATNGATLQLTIRTGALTGFNNTNGTIRALNAATPSTVVLLNGVTVTAGTLTTTGNGLIESGNSATLNGVTLSTGSTYAVPDNTNTFLQGTITNNGTIQLNSTNDNTDLLISGAVTLAGSGKVTLGNNAANRIFASNGTDTLTNKQTIQGAGQIGAGSMGLINNGTILANQPTALVIQPGSSGFKNNGTLNISSGDLMHVLGGPFTNFAGTTLTGGTYNVTGTLEIDQLGSTGGEIVTNAAKVILNGPTSSFVDAAGKNALTNLNTNATGSGFTIMGGRNFTTAGNFTNKGTLTVGSGSTFAVPMGFSLTNFSGTTLTGGTYAITGTLQFPGANITTNAAKLTLTGTASKIVDQTGITNGLANLATNASTGSLTLAGGRNLPTAGAFSNAGTVKVSKGSTLTVGGTANYTQTAGTTTVDGTLAVSAPGLVKIQGGSVFGTGTIMGNAQSSGTINVGDALKKAAKLAVTLNYTQTSSGILNIDVGGLTAGTQTDQFNVTDAATLNGTLNLDLINGFVPTTVDTFDIMNFASRTGMFSTVNGTAINGSEHFVVVYNATNVTLDVVSGALAPGLFALATAAGTAPTPEPSTVLLLGSGLIAILATRGRKRKPNRAE